MSILNKARIHALDTNGDILEDIDVYTSGDAVTMDNNRTLEDIYTNDIGTSSTLITTSKKIVGAINENADNIQNNEDSISDINLQMSQKVHYFQNVVSMKSANLQVGDSVITQGYYSYNDGGEGQYNIIDNVLLVDNGGTVHNLNNGLKAVLIIKNGEVVVNQFGAKGDGVTNDTVSIQNAITLSNTLTKKYNVKFLNQTYITTTPLTIYSNIYLVGNISNKEFGTYTILKNITTDMFTFTGTIYGHTFYGIQFIGALTTCPFIANADGTRWQKWGKYEKCGFVSFNKMFNTNTFWIGMEFFDSHIQAVNEVGTLSGSDNMLDKMFIDVVDMTENRPDYVLTLDNCDLSKFTSLYITGSLETNKGAKNMLQIKNGSINNYFGYNWFDYCDGSAIYLRKGYKTDGSVGDNCTGNTFIGNLFRGNLRVPTGIYQSIINIWGVGANTFIGNHFAIPHTGDYNANANVYSFRKEGSNVCRNIQVSCNTYDIPFKVLSTPSENSNIYINEPSINVKDTPNGATLSRVTQNIPFATYFDSDLNKPVWNNSNGLREVETLTLTNGATSSGNITITLNGVATVIAVTSGETIATIGNRIRNTSIAGWLMEGVVDSGIVTFTKLTSGINSAPTFSDTGTTGVTGSFVTTITGSDSVWRDSNGVFTENIGINTAVSISATSLVVTFAKTETNATYNVLVTPNWNTTFWVTGKSITGFTINFGTAPTIASALDWSIRR